MDLLTFNFKLQSEQNQIKSFCFQLHNARVTFILV